MSMYNFLQKNIKNNSENMRVNNMICTRSQKCRFCPDLRDDSGFFAKIIFRAFVCQCIKKSKDTRTSRVVVAEEDFSCIFLYIVFYALLFYAVFRPVV